MIFKNLLIVILLTLQQINECYINLKVLEKREFDAL